MTSSSPLISFTRFTTFVLCIIGLILAAMQTLFGIIASLEPSTYNWQFRTLYMLGFASCLCGIGYIFSLKIFRRNANINASNAVRKTVAAFIMLGLLIAAFFMSMVLRSMIVLSLTFPSAVIYPTWYFVAAGLSAASCIVTAIFFGKLLFRRQ